MRRLRSVTTLLVCLFSAISTGTYLSPPSALAAQSQKENKETTVWVNTSSGVYHCPGTRWYGNTKRGKYEGECEAISSGNRPAYGKACGSQCRSGLPRAPSASGSTPESTSPTPRQAGNPDAKVWVNTNSGVYHCPGTRWYGTTKQGEFMTQKKAQSVGYRPAYGKACQ
jgi:hypothetical protein